MTNKVDVKATIGGILQIITTLFFIFIFGVLFSYFTGYKSNDYPNIVRMIVWLANIAISWIVSTGLLKIFFRKKISFISLKFMFIATVLSVLMVWACGFGDNNYTYVTTFVIISSIIATIWGIKLISKKRGRLPKTK